MVVKMVDAMVDKKAALKAMMMVVSKENKKVASMVGMMAASMVDK